MTAKIAYVAIMDNAPAFLDQSRPAVPDIAVPRGVNPFYLPLRPVRGRLIKLGPLAAALLDRHNYPPCVTPLAGQALVMVAALATALKFTGSFSLQIKGDGPVRMLLADCTDGGALRGYASVDQEKLDALLAEHPTPTTQQLLGDGFLAFTVDQGPDKERHQGNVHYFKASEQTACFLRLACAETSNGWRASALVLERIAGAGGVDPEMDMLAQDESWTTALVLADTVKDSELLDDALPADHLLWRLFGTEGVAADRPRKLNYGCRCSRARLSEVLATFGTDDLDHMQDGGAITMTCEFCNMEFRFDRTEVGPAIPTHNASSETH